MATSKADKRLDEEEVLRFKSDNGHYPRDYQEYMNWHSTTCNFRNAAPNLCCGELKRCGRYPIGMPRIRCAIKRIGARR